MPTSSKKSQLNMKLKKALEQLKASGNRWQGTLESSLPKGFENEGAEPVDELKGGLLSASALFSSINMSGSTMWIPLIPDVEASKVIFSPDNSERAAMLAILCQLLTGILFARIGHMPVGSPKDPGTPAEKQNKFKESAEGFVRFILKLIELSMLSLVYAGGAAAKAGKFGESLKQIEEAIKSFLDARAITRGVQNRLKSGQNCDTESKRRELRGYLSMAVQAIGQDLLHIKEALVKIR